MRAALDKAAPWAPGFFLLLAAAAGGLRSPEAWLAAGSAWLIWTALKPAAPAGTGAAAALFFLWIGAAALFSPEPQASLAHAGRFAVLALFFRCAAGSPSAGGGWLLAVNALGAAGALTLLAQRYALGAAQGFMGANPNYTAAFCAAAFGPALLALSDAARGRKERALGGALALLLAAGLLASGSRGAALGALAAGAAGFSFTRRWRWLAGLLAAAALAALLLPGGLLEDLLKSQDPRAYARPRLWGAALRAALDSPLLGWGPGRFAAAFELYKFPFFDGISYYGHSTLHAHGEFFNLAAEAGFPAALLLAAAAWAAIARGGAERLPFRLAALAALLQASVDITFYSGAAALLFWGSLGFSLPPRPAAPPAARPPAPALVAAALCLLLPFVPRQGRAPDGGAIANPARALAGLRAERAASPFNALPAAGEGYALAALGDLPGAASAFARALRLEPNYAGARLGLAGALAAGGLPKEACLLLKEPRPAPGPGAHAFGRALLEYDAGAALRLEKEICGKGKAGAATATRRAKSSKATR